MPYIRSGKNAFYAFGFMPVESDGVPAPVHAYNVSSSETSAIPAGDIAIMSTIVGLGQNYVVRPASSAGIVASAIIGVFANSIPAASGQKDGDATSTGLILVYDSPYQKFVVSDAGSSAGGGIASSQVGYNVSVLATGGVGSTGVSSALNRSVQVIAGASSGTGSSGVVVQPFKILGLHPVDHQTSSSLGVNSRKWIVQPVNHAFSQILNATTG